MKHLAAAALACLCLGLAPAQAGAKTPAGKNCSLSAPPAKAGESVLHGVTLRVYPRKLNMGANYSGCQTAYLPRDKGRWQVMSLVQIKAGQPVALWSPNESKRLAKVCQYKDGKAVPGGAKDLASCPPADVLVMRSLNAGCVAKVKPGAAFDPANLPEGCGFE
jgi:hypothetical protein